MKPLRILIIEDEKSIRETFQWFLEDLGHSVTTRDMPHHCMVYQGGICGREQACTDVLIIDQHLPEMLGLDFLEQLKEHGCHGIMKNVLLMSGDATSIDPQRAKALGVTVAQKPISFDFLRGWLKTVKV